MTTQAIEAPSAIKHKREEKQDENDDSVLSELLSPKLLADFRLRALYVYVIDGDGFPGIECSGKLDHFVRLILGKEILRTPLQRNSSTSAVFDTLFQLPFRGQRYFRLELWDKETIGEDRLLGSKLVDLETLVEFDGITEGIGASVKLTGIKTNEEAGNLRVRYLLSEDNVQKVSAVFGTSAELTWRAVTSPVLENQSSIHNLSLADEQEDEIEETNVNEQLPEAHWRRNIRTLSFFVHHITSQHTRILKKCIVKAFCGPTKFEAVSTVIDGEKITFNNSCDFAYNGERIEVSSNPGDSSLSVLGRCKIDMKRFIINRENVFEGSTENDTASSLGKIFFRFEKQSVSPTTAKMRHLDV